MHKLFAPVCLAAGTLLSGCAVLTIDVDVYKGPLANHKDIQVRQLAALAMAAKPLLLDLRNDLETKERKERAKSDPIEPIENPDNFYANSKLKSDAAKRINSIGSSYLDSGDPVISPYIESANNHLRSLRSASNILEGKTPRNAEFVHQLEMQMVRSSRRGASESAIADFRDKYLKLLDPSRHSTIEQPPRHELSDFRKACLRVAGAFPQLVDQNAFRGSCEVDPGTNVQFDKLEKPETLRRHAALLFASSDSVPATQFQQAVRERAEAYRQRRSAIYKLWHLAADVVVAANAPGFGLDDTRRSEYTQHATPILAALTQPRNYQCALRRAVPGTNTKSILQDWNPQFFGAFYIKARKSLEGDLLDERKAFKTTTELLVLDEEFANADPAAIESSCGGPLGDPAKSWAKSCDSEDPAEICYLRSKASRAYGLAASAPDQTVEQIIQTITDQYSKTVALQAQGFEHGRPQQGIESLADGLARALDEAAANPGKKPEVDKARRRLEEVLVSFAERIVFLADNEKLRDLGIARDPKTDPKVRQVALLQAVGNSILVLADDNRNRDSHEAQLQKRAGPERRALDRAMQVSPPAVFDSLMARLRMDKDEVTQMLSKLPADPPSAAASSPQGAIAQSTPLQLFTAVKLQADGLVAAYECVLGSGTTELNAWIVVSAPSALPNDCVDLRRRFEKTADTVTVAQAQAALSVGIGGVRAEKYAGLNQSHPDSARLAQAKAYVDSLTPFAPDLAAKRNEWFKTFQTSLRGAVSKAQTTLRTMKNAADATDNEMKKVAGVVRSSQLERTQLEARQSLVNAALAHLDAVRVSVLQKLPADVNESGVLLQTRTEITALANGAVTGSTASVRADVSQLLARMAPSLSVDGLRSGPGNLARRAGAEDQKLDQRDVIDDLIATLRYQQISATAAGNKPLADQREAALKIAYEQRGNMAYLRPAHAYLRSVYAATTLQGDKTNARENLLSERFVKSFLGGGPRNDADGRAEIQREIDKQFWQNINTVNVSGGGASNYVVAKDDVGNWYVKSYESNPEAIIRSAKGLALFNLGNRFNVNLLRRDEVQRKLDAKDPPLSDQQRTEYRTELEDLKQSPGVAGNASLFRVYERYQKEYSALLAKEANGLGEVIESLPRTIAKKWNDIVLEPADDKVKFLAELKLKTVGLQAELDPVWNELIAKSKDGEADTERVDAIVRGLRAVARYARSLSISVTSGTDLTKTRAAVAGPGAPPEATNALKAAETAQSKAGADVIDIARMIIRDTADRRLESIKQTETAVGFLGEASTTGETPKK